MHRKRRKNNLTWLFALLGILVLFLDFQQFVV